MPNLCKPLGLALLLLVGCGETAPQPVAASFVATIAGTQAQLFDATLRTLTTEGYQITASDRPSGIIATAPTVKKLDETYCECPGSFGFNLAKEPRTVIHVAWSVVIAEGSATLRPSIEYAYLVEDPAFGRQGAGQSTGKLEAEMAAKITKAVVP